MSADKKNAILFGHHLKNHEAPWLVQKLETLKTEELKKIIEIQNEDIFALKLLQFEAQIKINQKDEEIENLKEIIKNKLMYKLNQSF